MVKFARSFFLGAVASLAAASARAQVPADAQPGVYPYPPLSASFP